MSIKTKQKALIAILSFLVTLAIIMATVQESPDQIIEKNDKIVRYLKADPSFYQTPITQTAIRKNKDGNVILSNGNLSNDSSVSELLHRTTVSVKQFKRDLSRLDPNTLIQIMQSEGMTPYDIKRFADELHHHASNMDGVQYDKLRKKRLK